MVLTRYLYGIAGTNTKRKKQITIKLGARTAWIRVASVSIESDNAQELAPCQTQYNSKVHLAEIWNLLRAVPPWPGSRIITQNSFIFDNKYLPVI